jgi:predicted unusual protein kinase regulating ubiquinone biosynthesis (AarF/ABC1/UbiB family)
LALSLKPAHLKRYKDIAGLLLKYGRGDLVQRSGIELERDEATEPSGDGKPEELAADLERLGPTYIKLGQLLSTRPELLPPSYIEALTRLQDQVEPFAFEEVERIVTEELGVRLSKGFGSFDPEPLAAASLGQVHRATLRDGRPVVVKVQRPGIGPVILDDLDAIEEIAILLDERTEAGQRYQFRTMVTEFRKSLLNELDYRKEAQNLTTLADNVREFERIVVPRPVDDYTTARVLTMDFVEGQKITSLSPVTLLGVDGEQLADELLRAYLKQILVDGFFHADPHPGNVFLTTDHRIALLDLGMVARIAPRMQQQMLQVVLAVAEGRGDETADFALKIGQPTEAFDEPAFRRRVAEMVAEHHGARVEEIQVGLAVMNISRIAAETGVRLAPELTLLGKTLLNLDGVGRTLAPKFDPNAAIRRHAAELMNQRMLKSFAPGNIFAGVLELKDFADRLPGRANKILDTLAENRLALKLDTGVDAGLVTRGLQKVANRIATGLVVAALIVSAARLMQVPTDFTIFGYPGFAMVLFLAAAAFGVVLVASIVRTDYRDRERGRRQGRG